ncbi:MAG: hypothetical protein JO364_10450 [Pseudonocardiales bacterium]|nr:hypothetical protein [Pseudonocardiales bacterium]
MVRPRGHAPRTVERSASPALCIGNPGGFANLVVERQGEEIILDPHVTGECVIIFQEDAARMLRDALIEWLG